MIKHMFPVAVVIAILSLAACDRGSAPAAPSTGTTPILQVYQVPPERLTALRQALADALEGAASVAMLPPDKLMVLAPPPLQSSIADNLKTMVESGAQAVADPGPIHLTLWIVDVADDASPDARLAALDSTLAPLRQALAAPGFVLRSQLVLTASASDFEPHSAEDGQAQMRVRLANIEGGVNADLRVNSDRMALGTQTRLKFGETVVLAQATPSEDGRDRVRLMLIRADLAD